MTRIQDSWTRIMFYRLKIDKNRYIVIAILFVLLLYVLVEFRYLVNNHGVKTGMDDKALDGPFAREGARSCILYVLSAVDDETITNDITLKKFLNEYMSRTIKGRGFPSPCKIWVNCNYSIWRRVIDAGKAHDEQQINEITEPAVIIELDESHRNNLFGRTFSNQVIYKISKPKESSEYILYSSNY